MNEGLQIENDCNFYANYSGEKKFRLGGGVSTSLINKIEKYLKTSQSSSFNGPKSCSIIPSTLQASGHYDGNFFPPLLINPNFIMHITESLVSELTFPDICIECSLMSL